MFIGQHNCLCISFASDLLRVFVSDLDLEAVGSWNQPVLGFNSNFKHIGFLCEQVFLGEVEGLVFLLRRRKDHVEAEILVQVALAGCGIFERKTGMLDGLGRPNARVQDHCPKAHRLHIETFMLWTRFFLDVTI